MCCQIYVEIFVRSCLLTSAYPNTCEAECAADRDGRWAWFDPTCPRVNNFPSALFFSLKPSCRSGKKKILTHKINISSSPFNRTPCQPSGYLKYSFFFLLFSCLHGVLSGKCQSLFIHVFQQAQRSFTNLHLLHRVYFPGPVTFQK